MEKRITELSKRLVALGYDSYQVKDIVKDAIGGDKHNRYNITQQGRMVLSLEKYVDLGSKYLQAYSK